MHLIKNSTITDHIGGNFTDLTVMECEYPIHERAAVGSSPAPTVQADGAAVTASAGAGNVSGPIREISAPATSLPDVVKTRDGQDLRLLSAQKTILQKLVHPFKRSTYNIVGLVKKECMDETRDTMAESAHELYLEAQGMLLSRRTIYFKSEANEVAVNSRAALELTGSAYGTAPVADDVFFVSPPTATATADGAGGEGGAGGGEPTHAVMRSSMVVGSQTYPIQRTLNMPPGTGKTVMSSVGVLTHMLLPGVLERMQTAFKHSLGYSSLDSTGVKVVTHMDSFGGPMHRVLLPNALLVHCPKQLVGAWRDTLAANAEVLSEAHGGRTIHVFPKNKGLTMPATFDPAPVLANPHELFVFVVHDANLHRFLVAAQPTPEFRPSSSLSSPSVVSSIAPVRRFSMVEVVPGVQQTIPLIDVMPVTRMDTTVYHYGAMVLDEADRFDYNVHNLYSRVLPPAMYNLIVTATPNNLSHDAGGLLSLFHPAPWDGHRNRMNPRVCPNGAWSFMKRDYLPTRSIGHLAPHAAVQATQLFDHLTRVMSSNVMSIRDLRLLMREVDELIEPMHSYAFQCRRSLQHQLGLVQHDMGNTHNDYIARIESSYELTLHGSSLDKVLESLGRKVDQCLAQIQKTSAGGAGAGGGLTAAAANAAVAEGGTAALAGFAEDVRELLVKLKRLRLLEGVLAECAGESCGVCWEPLGDKPSDVKFTTCCAFSVCKGCHATLVASRVCCPKCRYTKTRFCRVEDVDSDDDEASVGAGCSSSRGRGGAGAGAGGKKRAAAASPSDSAGAGGAAVPARKRGAGAGAGAGGGSGGGPPGSAAALAVAAEAEAVAHAAKNPATFEQFLRTGFHGENMSQTEAVAALLQKAGECGMTHIILAGPAVSTWPMMHGMAPGGGGEGGGGEGGGGGVTIEGFSVVRPSGVNKPRSALNLDRMYASFAMGALDPTQKCLLVLDTVVNNSTELTGIDAKKTDLIIQVTNMGTREAEYKQLMGRALRLGRKGYAVHVLLQ